MTQQVLLAGAGIALSVAIGFLAIGISIILKFERPKKWQGYLFFGLSVLMFILYYGVWGLGSNLTSQDEAMTNTILLSDDLLPLWLSALGTMLLALITFVIAIVIPWWRKPKFKIEFGNTEPFCRETTLAVSGEVQSNITPAIPLTLAYWLRLRVTNSGKSVARRCIGKLAKVKDDSGKELTNHDPVILHWVGTSWDDMPFRPIDLNQGEHEFLDVLVARTDYRGKVLICTDAYARGIPKDLSTSTRRIQITIYGDNVEPRTKEYRLTWGTSDYKDIRLE